MQRGDLSNEIAPKVGVRFENVLWNYGKPNRPGVAFCEDILRKNCNLILYSLLPERKVRAAAYKWNIPYTQAIGADSLLEIPELCRAHGVVLYVDTDDRLLQQVTERGYPRIEVLKWEQPIDKEELSGSTT